MHPTGTGSGPQTDLALLHYFCVFVPLERSSTLNRTITLPHTHMYIPYSPQLDPCVGSVDFSSPAPSGLEMQAGLAPGYSQIGSKMQGVDAVEGRDLIANNLENQGE